MSSRFVAALLFSISLLSHADSHLDESLPDDSLLSERVIDLEPTDVIRLQRHEDASIKIDGHLSEAIWAGLPAYDEFVVIEPDTLADPGQATRVRIFYDDSGLYFGIDMEQLQDTLVTRLSGRDARELNRDSISITLDTSGEGRYGYWFGVNLGDSLMDGTLLPERQFSSDWDGAWRGASQETSGGWSGELHIPWGTVAMPSVADKRLIGLYMSRKVAYKNERWGWPALPSTVPKFISQLQRLELSGIDPKQQFSIYPFTAATDDRVDGETRYRSGMDLFWRPSTNFQITATVNPDFGAAESDEVVINLSATETFFPEKRLFFLEGQEIFVTSPRADPRSQGVGFTGAPTTLINTRRIGGKPLEPEVAKGVMIPDRELIRPVDLLGAAKLTGQYGKFRYGVLTAFEDDVKFAATLNDEPLRLEGGTSDYGIARLLYEDSPGGAYKAFGVMTTATLNDFRDAMTHGLDGHYLSEDGSWKIDGQLYMSDIEQEETGFGGFLDFVYTHRKGVLQGFGIEYIDEHADLNDLGFLQRQDSFRLRTRHTRVSSDLGWARDNEFDLRGYVQKNRDGLFTGGGILFSDRITFFDLSSLVLRASFFPKSYDDLNSFGNGVYRIDDWVFTDVFWSSDSSRLFSYGFSGGYKRQNLGGDSFNVKARAHWQPNDRFSLRASVRYMVGNGWLLHQEDRNMTTFDTEQWAPQISASYFLNARQQFRFSLQWVGVKAREDEFFLVPEEPGELARVAKPEGPTDSFSLSQMSMQLRYRWEMAPLSDLFLVYTRLADNPGPLKHFSDAFSDGYDNPIVDSIVLKIRYRFGS